MLIVFNIYIEDMLLVTHTRSRHFGHLVSYHNQTTNMIRHYVTRDSYVTERARILNSPCSGHLVRQASSRPLAVGVRVTDMIAILC